jgi:hypothetical protein
MKMRIRKQPLAPFASEPSEAVDVTFLSFAARRSAARRSRQSGQSVVEFALIAPLMLIIMLAIIDFARIYTTMMTVESAAREAADYGTFGSLRWDPGLYNIATTGTEAQMQRRACVASRNLPDYAGPDDSCTNPTFSYLLSGDKGATWVPYSSALSCDDKVRNPPCWLKVTLHYDFHLIAPLNISVFGTSFGLPSTIGFDRVSIFPVTDLEMP